MLTQKNCYQICSFQVLKRICSCLLFICSVVQNVGAVCQLVLQLPSMNKVLSHFEVDLFKKHFWA